MRARGELNTYYGILRLTILYKDELLGYHKGKLSTLGACIAKEANQTVRQSGGNIQSGGTIHTANASYTVHRESQLKVPSC